MRQKILALALVFGLSSSAFAEETPEAIIKQAIEAKGGAKNLAKYKASRSSMSGSMSVMGMDLEFTGTMKTQFPDRYAMEINSEIMGQSLVITQIAKGDKMKSLVKVAGQVVSNGSDEEKAEMKMNQAMQEADALLPLLDNKKFKLSSGGEEDVDGKKASVINVTVNALKRDFKIYLDKKSNLMVKTSYRGQGFGEGGAPGEVLIESYYSEFKKFSDQQMATKLVVKHDTKKFLNITISDVELLEKIDDKEFSVDD